MSKKHVMFFYYFIFVINTYNQLLVARLHYSVKTSGQKKQLPANHWQLFLYAN
ncbi:hypothetical protein [Marinomonas colpomeniae]|uniref:Uncharacterized protein n=1 Tax=Marinomonas colpomeniae TaxID=2774408 RepID=A0ABR8NY50_9GAMM|nr:hypothetical protein [Marinomonas colpomeniae]MBD5770956.1 hypothetical protein [Marinomonas colpomeniae]